MQTLDCGIPYTLVFPNIDVKGKKALVELPDGMKQFSINIHKCFVENLGVNPIISMESTYGACDLQYNQVFSILKPDIIIHIGHSPYPKYLSPSAEPREPKIIYVKALSKLRPGDKLIEEASRILKGYGIRKLSIALTAQHTHLYDFLVNEMSKRGFEVIRSKGLSPYYEPGQILGCDFLAVLSKEADGYLFVGGGQFHPLGLYLATLKPVIQVDLYENRSKDFTPLGEKYLKKRYYKMSQAIDARRWGIIIGLKTGQFRPNLERSIIKMLKGRKYIILSSENLNEYALRSIDNEWFEAFVVTSCPRIAIDDMDGFEKPVLTPGEAYMVLSGNIKRYRFPW
ncbi:MAG: diphthamide biosynthesis enzyme Dph2 [Caldisphaeraceae archaeon]|nr:diphthamide biosynthesis enzyme Dph2 [Caldisphaeraceae archaeon]